jgi:UDP-N-acetylmuramoylalanine--D-glutamate ligase
MGKAALVIGLGVSGKASAELLLAKGYSVTAVDRRFEALKQDPIVLELMRRGLRVLSDDAEIPLSPVALVVCSPGIDPSHSLFQKARKAEIELLGEIELAFRYLPNRWVLGVTGSNGKTTTALLTAHILNAAGKKAAAVGNVGAALSGYALAPDKNEILVVELSSFQLETLSLAHRFDAAAILNITPNHLNRHASMEEYAAAKLRIVHCLKPGGRLFISRQVLRDYRVENGTVFDNNLNFGLDSEGNEPKTCHKVSAIEMPSGEEGVRLGLPEWANIAAARALCSFCKLPETAIDSALKTFRKPPHRIEWVAEIDGVAYYNDSKASNIEAVMHAVRLFAGPVILIAGGVDKGSSYAPWLACFQGKVAKVVVFGQAAEKMERELGAVFSVNRVSNLKEAVEAARMMSREGDTVLFSPGCSSYDQFANYEERGEMFKKIVRN